MNPGDSKAMEGIQNVERANGGEVEHDSGEEAEEPNGEGVSLEEVLKNKQFSFEQLRFMISSTDSKVRNVFYSLANSTASIEGTIQCSSFQWPHRLVTKLELRQENML